MVSSKVLNKASDTRWTDRQTDRQTSKTTVRPQNGHKTGGWSAAATLQRERGKEGHLVTNPAGNVARTTHAAKIDAAEGMNALVTNTLSALR